MKKILIADDQIDLLEVLSLTLESEFENEIVEVSSGNEAIDVLKTDANIGLIICDYKMDDGDGSDVFNYNKGAQNLPFILTSGRHFVDIKGLSDLYQVNSLNVFLQKPWDDQEFFDVVSKALCEDIENLDPSWRKLSTSFVLNNYDSRFEYFIPEGCGEFSVAIVKGEKLSSERKEELKKDEYFLYLSQKDFIEFLKQYSLNSKKRFESIKDLEKKLEMSGEVLQVFHMASSHLGMLPEELSQVTESLSSCVDEIQQSNSCKVYLDDSFKQQGYYIGHSLIAMQCCYIMLKKMSLNTDENLKMMTHACLLHDIALPSSRMSQVLDKESLKFDQLTAAEKSMVYRHGEDAYNLTREVCSEFEPLKKIISSHHERPDGKGFPDGLTGEDISEFEAIFILAIRVSDFLFFNGKNKQMIKGFRSYLKSNFSGKNFDRALKSILESF